MKHINEAKINNLLEKQKHITDIELNKILEKSKSLQRLTLEEAAGLLSVTSEEGIQKILDTACYVKDKIYGRRVVLFAPLYITNTCINKCRYCSFNADNSLIKRKTLSIKEIKEQTEILLKKGHKRILLVAGEGFNPDRSAVDYYIEAINAIYSVRIGKDKIRRININCAPLNVEEFKKLKASGIGTYQLFQETYHQETYDYVHISGPKKDADNRMDAIDRAFAGGIDDLGIGVLYGLYEYKFETLALLMHVEYLENKYNVGPHTISVPRIEPAAGAEFTKNIPHELSDEEFKKTVAILRLAVPYTGLILSTRETPEVRDELLNIGVSQMSAESKTSPGGYKSGENEEEIATQFSLNDHRSLDEVIGAILEKDYTPSFCTACYRSSRTGEAFMNLAKPGIIKGKCKLNALITLKEYLDDFASPEVKKKGYTLINKEKDKLNLKEKEQLSHFFEDIDKGLRDEYI
jgi:2-iminoacetate synthase